MTKRRISGGFGGPSGSGMDARNPGNMLKQLQKMQEDMKAAQEALENETLEITAGGGAVSIIVTGHQRIKDIKINPELLNTADPEWATDLQDLLIVAVNQAIEESQKRAAERMEAVSGGLDSMMPGGLGGLLGG